MTDRYAVVALRDLGHVTAGQAHWHTIRSTLDVRAFGVNAWTATEDAQQLVGEHTEAAGEAHEEVYVVLSGHATFTLDGEALEAPEGTVVHVADPSVKRGATGARGTTILAVGAKPGEAFTPSSWERSAEALRYWPTEEWDEAIEVLERHLDETPDDAGVLYNLACAKARAGRADEALADLRRAVELRASLGEAAHADDDLASLRDDPAFPTPQGE